MEKQPSYLKRLGLNYDPFTDTPARGVEFYRNPTLDNHLNTLLRIVTAGNFVAMVKGDRGTGKSTLLNALHEQLRDRPDIDLIAFECHHNSALLDTLAEAAGLDSHQDGVDTYQALNDHLTRLRVGGLTTVVAVDEAHRLSTDDLILLLRFSLSSETVKGGLLRIVLFAEPSIEAKLSAITSEMPTSHVYTLVMPTFSVTDTQGYIEHRLKAAGYTEESLPLKPARLTTIHRKSAGLPAAINRETGQQLRGSGGGYRRPLAALVGLILTVGLGLILWQSWPVLADKIAAVGDSSASDTGQQTVREALDTPVDGPSYPAPDQTTVAAQVEALSKDGVYTPPSETGADDIEPLSSSPSETEVNLDEVVPDPTVTGDSESVNDNRSSSDRSADNSVGQVTDRPNATVTSSPTTEPEQTPPPPSTSDTANRESESSQQRETADIGDTISTADTTVAAAAAAAAADQTADDPVDDNENSSPTIRREDWLTDRNADEWILQLMASTDEAALRRYIQRHDFIDTPGYFRDRRDDRDWFILVIGPYQSQQQAQDAITRLPADLKRNKPWARRLGVIQSMIKANR